MKKKVLLFLCIIVLCMAAAGCSGSNFDQLSIVVNDASDVPAGEYNLVYTIPNFEKFNQKFTLSLKVYVYDDTNSSVAVKNNRTITIKADRVYTVTVICSANVSGEAKEKEARFTVSAIKTPPAVVFYANEDELRELYRYPFDWGGSMDFDAVPEVPDFFPPNIPGITHYITSKEWVVFVDGSKEEERPLTAKDLQNLTTTVKVHGRYEYRIEKTTLTIAFENDGGSATEPLEGMRDELIKKPESPTKSGYYFEGWYTERELTNRFSWRENLVFLDTFKLFAKWVPKNDANNALYEYKKQTDNDGYDFYQITPKTTATLPDDIIIPSGYDNIPVKSLGLVSVNGIKRGAFMGTNIKKVTFPAHFDGEMYEAFRGCTQLREVIFEEGSQLTYLDSYAFMGCSALQSIALPDGVTRFNTTVFKDCTSLQSVKLSASLVSVNDSTFENCPSLREIALPDKVLSVGDKAFYGCTALTNAFIGELSIMNYIAVNAFQKTALTSIVLPQIFQENGYNPFKDTEVNVTYHPKLPEKEEEK